MPSVTRLMDAPAMARALSRMATEIVERGGGTGGLVLVGIQRRGVELAARLASLITAAGGAPVPIGKLDITLYRDDLSAVGPRPVVGETSLPGEIEGSTVVIVDDVLYTGRTIRAALDEITDFGRPRRILLSVLVDRGGRELPIQADVVGLQVPTAAGDRVDVAVMELDGRDSVELVREAPV
ncbi:MAG TPA: bifunctional pyr operon transcriptional regulator/uracil phosphoribosyltransferase PyrR [Gemmatimonadales bacterium]|jgi:pyrimidine operon attenuation protein/uracil phosphoribosyltransferase|nr:bifunctional pyr operon transcriptional regulator/uracil phosphoribosyltransferase PyrR [Gemmatimonadales bacterium]